MVFEQLLESSRVKKHPFFIILLCFFYVLVAYGVAYIFFESMVSVVAIFTLTLLLVPSLHHLLCSEENIERKAGIHHFLRNHRDFFKVYGFSFLGVVLGLLVVNFMLPADLFSYQTDFLVKQQGITRMQEFGQRPYAPGFSDVMSLFSFNLEVALICLVLSVFYGAGAVFLVVFNASLFATFFLFITKNIGSALVSSVLFFQFLPEILGFLLAAVAGAILSAAIVRENWHSFYFRHVLQNTVIMFLIAIALIFLAALIEIFASASLIHGLI